MVVQVPMDMMAEFIGMFSCIMDDFFFTEKMKITLSDFEFYALNQSN